MSNISILILAAGKGTRMKSDLPKVLHQVGGVSLVERVCRSAEKLKPSGIAVIVGHGAELVRNEVRQRHPKAAFFTQRVLNGTGGALRQAASWLKKQKGDVIVTCGDAPLIRAETFSALVAAHRSQKNLATVLTTELLHPRGYGRIIRESDGAVERIVEELDATEEERRVHEINTGTYCFNAKALASVLPKLRNDNAKKEFYLTDTLELLRDAGGRIGAEICPDSAETIGINSRIELSMAEQTVNQRKLAALMTAGVTIIDPASTYVSDEVQVAADAVLLPQTHLVGKTAIGAGCQIGPFAYIKDCRFENDVIFKASFADSAVVRRGAKIGPFSHIRPKSDLGPNVHMGNFSEVKNARVQEGAKINHLSYLGDAFVGKSVNIGAGTITCNYDGFAKHPTEIQDHVFVGSNVNLIAPITVGRHAVIGAGSTLSEDVPAWALAVERSKSIVKKDWAKHRAKKRNKK